MEGEGVATAAIGSSKFFDMIVWEVVFPMMGQIGPDRVWKLQASFVFHLKQFFRQGRIVWGDGASVQIDDRRLYAVGTEKFRILEDAIEHTK